MLDDPESRASAQSPAEMMLGCAVAALCALVFAAAVLGIVVYVAKALF